MKIAICVLAGLVFLPCTFAAADKLQTRFEELQKEYKSQETAYFTARDAVPADALDRLVQLRKMDHLFPSNSMVDQFLAFEADCRGTKLGLSALHHLVSAYSMTGIPDSQSGKGFSAALTHLSENYAEHNDLDLIVRWCDRSEHPAVTGFLDKMTQSPHRHVQAAAHLNLARIYSSRATVAATLKASLSVIGDEADLQDYKGALQSSYSKFEKFDTEESRRMAVASLRKLLTDYPEELEPPRTLYGPIIMEVERSDIDALTKQPRRAMKTLASSIQYELDHLSIGSTAPDIVGPDADGQSMCLNEFKGNVVVLMFSFKGCGPCEAMYPENRELITELHDRDFRFIGVMGDQSVDTVHEAVKEGNITWPVWWDGGNRGPIATQWNVAGWPTVYVLDRDLKIRFIGPRGKTLRKAVISLLDEPQASKASISK